MSIVCAKPSRAAIILALIGCANGRESPPYEGLVAERSVFWEVGDFLSGEALRGERDFLRVLEGLVGFSWACIVINVVIIKLIAEAPHRHCHEWVRVAEKVRREA